MPSPTSNSTPESDLEALALAMVRRLDLDAHRRIARAKARLSGCASTLLDIEREIHETLAELASEHPERFKEPRIINLESAAAVREWRPGDAVSRGLGAEHLHTDSEAFIAEQLREQSGLADRPAHLAIAVADVLWTIDASKPAELASALLYLLERLSSEQVAALSARVRECAE